MKTASRVMYTIATIVNWVLLACGIACIVGGSIGLVNATAEGAQESINAAGTTLGSGIYLALIQVPALFLAGRAKKGGIGWQIVMMVIGIVSGDIFYFLGALFGIIAGGNKN